MSRITFRLEIVPATPDTLNVEVAVLAVQDVGGAAGARGLRADVELAVVVEVLVDGPVGEPASPPSFTPLALSSW
jgi:hypothetical protein